MIKIEVSKLEVGMKLAKDVILNDGKILLLKGFVVKEKYIKRLELQKVQYVFVEKNFCLSKEEINEEQVYKEAFNTVKNVLNSVRDGFELDVESIKNTVEELVEMVLNNETVFMNLSGIRDIDNYTFLHSLDVCTYSLITGKNLGFSKDELIDLGICAILHDVGKCKIPLEILLKPSKLTPDEFHIMKLHTIYGNEIVRNTSGLSKHIPNVITQHHEKWDGSGYPLGLSEYAIDKFARIITIADIYDALTADRVYKKKDLPHEAAEFIVGNSGTLFDPNIVNTFINNIAIYPEKTIVLLNTGEIAQVIETERNFSIRPNVKVIARKEGPPILEPYRINLMKNRNVFIVEILS